MSNNITTKRKKKSTKSSKRGLAGKRVTKIAENIEYVIPLGNAWMVKNSLAKKFTVITDSKREAISIARGIAQRKKIELIVYARKGGVEIHEKY